MNDIQLTPTSDGYDWNFTNGDISDVIGDQQIISSLIHTILLRQGELEQLYYQDKGSTTYNLQNKPNTELMTELIKSDIESLCKTLPEVYDAEATITTGESNITITRLTITKQNGGLLQIGI